MALAATLGLQHDHVMHKSNRGSMAVGHAGCCFHLVLLHPLTSVLCCVVQRKEKVRLRTGPKPLMQRLLDGLGAFLLYFQKAKKAHGIPRMVIQLLLPESKQQLQQLLGLYSKHGLLATQEGSSRLSASGTDVTHDAAATIITKGEPSTEKAAALLDSMSNKWQEAASSPAQQAVAALAAASGPQWWQRFSRQVTCLCITELRFGLLAHSCMGCPGTITLVSNLIRAVDDGLLTQAEFEELPEWAQVRPAHAGFLLVWLC